MACMTHSRARRTAFIAAIAAVAAAVTGLVAAGPATAEDTTLVQTGTGWVRGAATETTRTFQGIPYAQPPVGDLRWRATEPVEAWDEVRDATAAGSPCPQPGWEEGQIVGGSEDCLFLNVDTPLEAEARMPVMVFLHGGLIGGQGAPYDPTRIVDQGGVVVVTVNYRLGALGFLSHPAIDDPYAGNFALGDQQEALRWVGENIAAFGGDPGNITLWGESAGGFTTCAQLASPAAEGLFHKAIVQSATCSNDVLDVAEANTRGQAMAEHAGCTEAATAADCLRDAPLESFVTYRADEVGQLRRHINELPWFPVAGTEVLPRQPLDALRRGAAADIPLLHGATKDEARFAVNNTYDGAGRPVTAEEYPGILRGLFGRRDAARILDRYPLEDYPSPSLALATLATDYGGMIGTCSQLPALEAAARHGSVHTYEFAEPVPSAPGEFPQGATHGADIPLFFDSRWAGATQQPQTGGRAELAEVLIGAWTDFAATGDPGWRPYRDGRGVTFSVDHTGPVNIAAGHHCGFWLPRL
ncbi:para-nitrobenzyl esterase [Glycomyces sambucus]|uniref:Carboxylic ester hydrolase n=2 Tax=Glycomyces sambucus TaxID=380244 RepID=A0A1G9G3V7_9ACTN|nr:para-nitrobenzyl esterase [Glycomyces sambucus]